MIRRTRVSSQASHANVIPGGAGREWRRSKKDGGESDPSHAFRNETRGRAMLSIRREGGKTRMCVRVQIKESSLNGIVWLPMSMRCKPACAEKRKRRVKVPAFQTSDRSQSTTSRKKRTGEADGRYRFVHTHNCELPMRCYLELCSTPLTVPS